MFSLAFVIVHQFMAGTVLQWLTKCFTIPPADRQTCVPASLLSCLPFMTSSLMNSVSVKIPEDSARTVLAGKRHQLLSQMHGDDCVKYKNTIMHISVLNNGYSAISRLSPMTNHSIVPGHCPVLRNTEIGLSFRIPTNFCQSLHCVVNGSFFKSSIENIQWYY